MDQSQVLPDVLAEVHRLQFFVDHDGHDFEPYDDFMWSGEMLEWWRAWTGNSTADVPPFLAFGQDGSGGLAAIWVKDPDASIESQPVVFLGSEGELAVIAKDCGDYIWLLANGVGPLEAVDGIDGTPEPIPAIMAFVQRYTGQAEKPIAVVLSDAHVELAVLSAFVDASVR